MQRGNGGAVGMEESAQPPTSIAVEQPVRPAGTSRAAWRTYWRSRGQRWRTEPEIDESRQQELAVRRGVVSSIARGVYPFRGIMLGRADIEWLLATYDSGRGPLTNDLMRQAAMQAFAMGIVLSRAHTARQLDHATWSELIGGVDHDLATQRASLRQRICRRRTEYTLRKRRVFLRE